MFFDFSSILPESLNLVSRSLSGKKNINIVKRHTKPNPQAGQAGGVVEREAPIHASNVMPFNPATGKGERIGTKKLEDGRTLRVFRSSGEALDA